jgi:two-component system sensor histidine kinase ResE
MLPFLKNRVYRLGSQLTFTFLAGFLGIGAAIGLPVVLLISQQSSSHAQRLLDQAVVAARAFMEQEESDLQSLALLISQRPTLLRFLQQGDFSSLDTYLETLRESVDLDLIAVCSQTDPITEAVTNLPALCDVKERSGFASLSTDSTLVMYATAAVIADQQASYTVMIAKNTSSILADLQRETGLVYFLIRGNRTAQSSESSIEITPALTQELLLAAGDNPGGSLQQRAFRLDEHRYLLSDLQLNSTQQLTLVSALNVDDQIAVQQSLSSTLILGLFFILLVASALGIWLSQRISRPLVRLAGASAEFRRGNLETPIAIQSQVYEIDQLANTLEDGRIALRHSLQELQAEKAWIEHLLNSIVEGMITLDTENQITFASAGIGKITEADPDRLIGQSIDEIFLPLEGEVDFSKQLPSIGQQRRISVKLGNGQEKLLSISKSKLIPPEASDSNQALVIRDVSNEEYIHRLLGDFMANITHEFRTPLAALEASSELLIDNLHSLSRTEVEDLLVSLNLGIINLQTLIDNLIEAASIEAGRFKVSLQPVAFGRILREALGTIQPLVEKYSLQLVIQPVGELIVVMADPRRTVQVLVNLLSNAVKHSPENGIVQIKHAVIDHHLRVQVIDEGSGVPPTQHGNLFRRFAHLETANERAKQGAGLGLSVVKEIVEAQQGKVGITERAEGGTSFWFTLPLIHESVQE